MKKVILVFISVLSVSILFIRCGVIKTACLPPLPNSPCARELAAINHNISTEEAKEMIKRFQSLKSEILSGTYKDSVNLFPDSEAFNRDAIYNLLRKDSVVGLRISLGLTSDKKVRLVLTPVIPPCGIVFNGEPECLENGQTPVTPPKDPA